jgi:tetratricopeptide (TPR) repeat protein
MTGDADTIALYDRAIDRLVRYHPDVVELVDALNAASDPVPMASALAAYLCLSSTDHDDLAAARLAWETMATTAGNEREALHREAIGAWLRGDWTGAASLLDVLLQRWPTDVLALMIGHLLDFFVGDAQSLRDRPIRSLRELPADDPHTGFVLGMAAFGLEEAGHYSQALDTGLAAVTANPDDVWGIHAVIHTYEMQGRVDEGVRFLGSEATRWENGNMFTVHNWWHLALYHLEAGRPQQSLDIHDAQIHHADSAGVPIEMLDGTALLWRLMLDGIDTGDRFATLAQAWTSKVAGDPWYAFNDLHAVMALAGADRVDDAERVIESRQGWLQSQARSDTTATNVRMTADIGLPSCRAAVAFVEGRHEEVIDLLMPIRRQLHHFGGSHAQRDALQRTLLESALRGHRYELARALTSERLGVRESSTYSWSQRARALRGLDEPAAAAAAEQRAVEIRDRVSANR